MKYSKLLAASKTPSILAVIENLPVSANGFFMTAEQMENVEAALGANETAAADLAVANASLATEKENVTRITGELTETKGKLTASEAEVTRLGALGAPPAATVKTVDEFESKDVDPMAFDFQQDILKRLNS